MQEYWLLLSYIMKFGSNLALFLVCIVQLLQLFTRDPKVPTFCPSFQWINMASFLDDLLCHICNNWNQVADWHFEQQEGGYCTNLIILYIM